jgi:hypothetical protein
MVITLEVRKRRRCDSNEERRKDQLNQKIFLLHFAPKQKSFFPADSPTHLARPPLLFFSSDPLFSPLLSLHTVIRNMLRRDPTRIELKAEDLADFERAREEYLAKEYRKTFKAEPTEPPPTPAGRELRSTASGAGNSRGAVKDLPLDAVEVSQQVKEGKTISQRILGGAP